jgi:hypothetical protein
MVPESAYKDDGLGPLLHTPDAAVVAGQVLQLDCGLAAIVPTGGIAASAEGTVHVNGDFDVRNVAIAGNQGDNVWWDENGTGVDGNTGACTTDASVGDFWIGTLAKDLEATDTRARVSLNKVNPYLPPWVNRTHIKKTADYTVLGTDNGKVVHCDGSAEGDDIIVITMTAIATLGDGFECIIQNDAADGESQITIEVNASDKFLNPTALDDGDTLDNTLATAVRGDFVKVRSTAAGFYIEEMRGTWADGGAT